MRNNDDLLLLDCTLRDGGYINDWKWGYDIAKDIISYGVKAGVDIIEVGFLRNIEKYDPSITVANTIEELNNLLPPQNVSDTMFCAMAMRSNYDINKLIPYSGSGIEMIRVTAHDYDISEGIEFARQVKNRGYKVSINPINIMGYTDKELLNIIDMVNDVNPYQFAIVDTFGSMKKDDMERMVRLFDHNLNKKIRLALHLHENMSLSCLLAEEFISMHVNRPISVDASLMGMGRDPGNLPIEVIADYLNYNEGKKYNINYLMDAIDNYISPIKGKAKWGYTTAYFLSAKFNLHRNYSEYYLKKGNLTCSDIYRIFDRFDKRKASVFDKKYAEEEYQRYMNVYLSKDSYTELEEKFHGKNLLLLAPGLSLNENVDRIKEESNKKNTITVSLNFVPGFMSVDFCFFSNSKRLQLAENIEKEKLIVTSNIKNYSADYIINYNRLNTGLNGDYNSLLLFLNLVKEYNVLTIFVAGADGYSEHDIGYYRDNLWTDIIRNEDYNKKIGKYLSELGMQICFITPSLYEKYVE